MAHESKKTQQENARFVRKSCRDILVKIRIGLVEERSGFQFWKRDKVKNKPFSFCPLSRELITMKKIWKYHENQRHRISTICKFQNFIASGTKMCKNCTLRLKGYFGHLRLMGLKKALWEMIVTPNLKIRRSVLFERRESNKVAIWLIRRGLISLRYCWKLR